MIKYLNKVYPNCKIDLLCGVNWGAEKVLEHSDLINQIHWLPLDISFKKKFEYLNALANQKYDLVFMPFDSTPFYFLFGANYYLKKSKLIAHTNIYASGRKNLIKRLLCLSLLTRISWVPVLHGRHEIDLNLDLVDLISFENRIVKKDRKTFVSYQASENTFSLPKDYIVLQPFARNGIATPKTWPLENYYELANKWLEINPKYSVVLVGDKYEINISTNHPISKLEGTINLIGKTNFSQLCNVIKNASGVVANDSGIMHITDALEIPLVALYGPTDHTRTKPLSSTSRILYSKNSSFCNMYAFKYGEDETLKKFGKDYCMKDISVQSVITSLKQVINDHG